MMNATQHNLATALDHIDSGDCLRADKAIRQSGATRTEIAQALGADRMQKMADWKQATKDRIRAQFRIENPDSAAKLARAKAEAARHLSR
jgi:hypothetical protein